MQMSEIISTKSEPLIALVGFLGAGKTTLLETLAKQFTHGGHDPLVIINDYQDADLDSQRFKNFLSQDLVQSVNGSCICCSGVEELRNKLNELPSRENGVTLIEANGTTDACTLMELLSVGIDEKFAPPVQVSVVNVRDWQKRGVHNELEANQVQVSSLIVLTHEEEASEEEITKVRKDLGFLNPFARILSQDKISIDELGNFKAQVNSPNKLDHQKSHWASCSIDLPDPLSRNVLQTALQKIPESILRVKGCTRLDNDEHYTYFERVPSQGTYFRELGNDPNISARMLAVGPGSDPAALTSLFTLK